MGTDIAELKVAAIADTPKVMTEGNWRFGDLRVLSGSLKA